MPGYIMHVVLYACCMLQVDRQLSGFMLYDVYYIWVCIYYASIRLIAICHIRVGIYQNLHSMLHLGKHQSGFLLHVTPTQVDLSIRLCVVYYTTGGKSVARYKNSIRSWHS